MSLFRYAIKSLLHFRKLNLTIALGIALSTAILLGAFIIGDTVSFSLKQITLQRLGKTDWVVTGGERLFREKLAEDLQSEGVRTCPMLSANGMAVLNGGKARVNQIQVWGVDSAFDSFAGTDQLFDLNGNEAVINEQLADILGVQVGEELLLRVNKLTTFPANTPFVSADESTISFRVKVKSIATNGQTGNFNLQNIQSSPKNIFLSLDWLNRQMQLDGKANVILVNGENSDQQTIQAAISKHWKLEDLNFQVRRDEELNYAELVSDRVFIEDNVAEKLLEKIPGTDAVFSYFVNEFERNGHVTPYSFVAGLPDKLAQIGDNEIILNSWIAADLSASVGNSLQMTYFEVGPLRQLVEKSAMFRVSRIVEMEGNWADVNLMPDIPGLSDAGHCSDWETGVPVDLSKIRQKDEDYWNQYKGTPKAFISLATAQKLWRNRFGSSTAIRANGLSVGNFQQQVLADLSIEEVGFQIKDVRSEGLQAASEGVNFGQLFIGLSFFVLFASLLLAYLMFQLYLNFRSSEIGTLHALGFERSKIRKLFFAESAFLIVIGSVIGSPIGVFYNRLILDAINTIWRDIVRTSILYVHITPNAIAQSLVIVVSISLITVWFILRKFARQPIIHLQKADEPKASKGKWSLRIGLALIILSVILVSIQGIGQQINPEIFYTSGFGLLPGLILLLNYGFIRQENKPAKGLSYLHFSLLILLADRRRNILIVSFLSVGIFLVLSTGLNRQDLTRNADQPSSGTGGYTYFAETSFPILYDLNTPQGQSELGLEDLKAGFVQLQAQQGDDASCLNLNRVKRPRILGFDPSAFDERKAFTFATQTEDLNPDHPWLSLNKLLPNGEIPAIADQTVILWGLGKSVGDTIVYRNEAGQKLVLKLIGGLANSVFQGNILISDNFFYQNFPSISGSQFFLIQATDSIEEQLRLSLRNYGLELTSAKERLLLYYQVENTYLNIFLLLGFLGLLIGTIGLAILIYRSILEKRAQFALLEAVGFQKQKVRRLVLQNNMLIVGLSLIIGLIPSILSALPSLASSLYARLIYWCVAIIVIVLVNAWLWVFISNRLAMRGNLHEALRND